MEKYIWSLDISTTNVGFALWNEKGKLIELKHLELKNEKDVLVEDRDIVKADVFKRYCIAYAKYVETNLNGTIVKIFVEAPLSNTPVNINTTALLLGFNGMARFVLYEVFNLIPQMISVYNSRKLFLSELVVTSKKKGEIIETLSFPEEYRDKKKIYVWEKVARLEPQIEWFYTKNNTLKSMNFDLSDSYAVGYAGLIVLGILEKNGN
jgi:hypothetical protein